MKSRTFWLFGSISTCFASTYEKRDRLRRGRKSTYKKSNSGKVTNNVSKTHVYTTNKHMLTSVLTESEIGNKYIICL